MTFHEARIIGTSLLASAGVAAAIAAFAANTLLSNLIAGLQIAFGKSLRLDDVVVINNEWGRIEDITLTYIVLHIWDDRRLILPSTYFTTTPFENWTRQTAALLGTVELDVDWRVPVDELRAHLKQVVEGARIWDGRTAILQVTDAVNSLIRLRILVSAEDSGALFDLRCLVREAMVSFLQHNYPEALPRQRWEAVGPSQVHDGAVRRRPEPPARTAGDAQLFTGSVDAVERSRSFSGPGEEVFEERGRKADGDR
jgi:hypothetical protein